MALFFSKAEDGQPPPLNAEKAKSIDSIAGEIRSKTEPSGKRGPGRPKKVVDQPASGEKSQPETPVSEADIEFCRTIAKAALQIVDRVETNIITGTIQSIGDKYLMERTDTFLKQREITPADEEIVVNAVGALAAKYSALSRYAPEGALILWAATHGMAFSNVLSTLRQVGKEIRKTRGHASRSPADEDSDNG